MRCSAEAHQRAERCARRAAVRHQHTTHDAPLRSSAFIIVCTTLSRQWLSAHDVLTLYRNAWQAELVFKRLKELVQPGAVPKTDSESCTAWLHARLVVALLAERLHREAHFVSLWGYPLPQATPAAHTSEEPVA